MGRSPAQRSRALPGPTRSGLGQGVLVAVCAGVYFLTRAHTEGSVERANENGSTIYQVEQQLGIAWENTVQSVVLAHHGLTTACNWIYIWGHWPVIITALVVLHHVSRELYFQLRNAMIVSGAIGMVIFARFPVAPPRLLPEHDFVDSISTWSHSYRVLQPPSFVNHYAAMPSLHVGWNLLVGIVIWRATTRWVLRCLAVASPCLMAWAVVATANHYVLDVLAGALVALLGYAVALVLARSRGLRTPTELPPVPAAAPPRPARGSPRPVRGVLR